MQQKNINPIVLPPRGTEALINKKIKAKRLILTYLITKTLGVKKPRPARPKAPVTPKNIKILNFYNFLYSAKIYKAEIILII